MPHRPTGVVTFLMTDIEGSTRAWEDHPVAMQAALPRHDEIIRSAVESNGGYVFSTAGDGFGATFTVPGDAIAAAIQAQRAMESEDWPRPLRLRVRMGLHTGEADERDGDYFGTAVNQAARITDAAHGGQVLLSGRTADEVEGTVEVVDLGLHRLKDLTGSTRLYQLEAPRLLRERRSIRPSAGAALSTLPAPRTPILGRQEEIGEVLELINDHRLVTILGPGGVGKTRLAIETLRRADDAAVGSTHFIDLADERDGRRVGQVIATGLRLPINGDAPASSQLREAIGARPLLAVIDNCEHLIDDAAAQVDLLLEGCPGVRIIATSREGLGVAGERVLRLEGLRCGGEEADGPPPAVELFLERWPGAPRRPSAEQLGWIGDACRRLDGLPLAIELAAARADVLALHELTDGLAAGSALLTDGRRGTQGRHRTLEATVAWSYDMLTAEEQRAFRLLSVAPAGFDLALAAGILDRAEAEAVDILQRLAARSLLVPQPDVAHPTYRLLETIRAYGLDRLEEHGEAAEARSRHAAVVSAVLMATGSYFGALTVDALRLYADVRAALDWARARGDRRTAARLLPAAVHVLGEHGRLDEASELASWAAEEVDDEVTQASVYGAQAVLGIWRFDPNVFRLAGRLVGLVDHPEAVAAGWALRVSFSSLMDAETFEANLRGARSSVRDDAPVDVHEYVRFGNLCNAIVMRDDERALRVLAEPARPEQPEFLAITAARWCLYAYLGRAEELAGTRTSPMEPLDEALELQQVGGDNWLVPVHLSRAATRAGLGDVDGARQAIADVLARRPVPRGRAIEEDALVNLALCCVMAGERDRALTLLRQGVTIARLHPHLAMAIRMRGDLEGIRDEDWERWRVNLVGNWLATWSQPDVHDKARRMLADELTRLGLR